LVFIYFTFDAVMFVVLAPAAFTGDKDGQKLFEAGRLTGRGAFCLRETIFDGSYIRVKNGMTELHAAIPST
jgi:hypothetical protein